MNSGGMKGVDVSGQALTVAWRRVWLFYGIAFGGAVLVAAAMFGLRQALGPDSTVITTVVAALVYMPLPLVAGLITERMAGRRPLIAAEWRALRSRFWRTYGRNAAVTVVAILAIVTVAFLVAWLAGAAQLPGAGHLVGSEVELREQLLRVNPAMGDVPVPPPAVLALTTILQGTLAGLTINGLVAFGEEYGWRGVLADELRPLGAVRANLLTGALWGFWHAPIILFGHNYGPEWGWGIFVMIAWVTPFSFLLWWSRERTGSVLAPAMLHGAGNGVLGMFAFLIAGGHVLIALPVGLLLALVMAIVALIAWRLPTPARASNRLPRPAVDPAEAVAEPARPSDRDGAATG